MAFRFIVADMDDTLLNGPDLTERTIKALAACRERGAYTVLASGRMVESMLPTAELAQVNAPIIAYNGGLTYDIQNQKVLHESALPVDVSRAVCELAEFYGLHVQSYQDGGYFFEKDNHFAESYAKSTGIRGTALGMKLSKWIKKPQYKLLVYDTTERVGDLLLVFQERFAGQVNCLTSKPYYLESIPPGADKGVAVKALSDSLGVAREEILAFGDGLNDIGMLQYAGRGYAMGNADAAVKYSADAVAPQSREDGVAQVLEQLLNSGEI